MVNPEIEERMNNEYLVTPLLKISKVLEAKRSKE
jgi:hypothetical protein